MGNGTRQQNKNRRSDRRTEAPQRVQNAAEQMRYNSAQGTFRGYVPQAPAPHAIPQPRNIDTNNGLRGISMAQTNKGKKPGKKNILLTILLTLLAVAVIAGGVAYGIKASNESAENRIISDKVSPYDGLYCPGVYVDGIHLGGMTPEQAMNTVQSQISQRNDAWSVQLVYGGEVVAVINAGILNMTVDHNQVITVMNEAWLQGHNGSERERFSQMQQLEQAPYYAFTAKPDGNTEELDRILAELKARIDIQPQDASLAAFDPSRAYPFIFNHEVVGRSLNTAPVLEELYKMVSTMTSGTLELVPETIQPRVFQAELETHYALRSSVSTPIDRHSTDDRNNNIRRCFQLISGTILEPGKKFSFNRVVGERSTENGFYPAIEYINDEHVVGIGGGACQASTTLYQAAVCAGLEIRDRRPHSDSVSYADYGTDATVYFMRGGKQIDLTFVNNTEGNIYIVASVIADPSNTKRLIAKVSIYGESLGNISYRLETEIVETLPSILEPVYVADKDSAARAKDGCIVNSYRVQYTDGVMTGRTFLFNDTYKPKPEKIYDPGKAK